ncbi:MarR family winged helix-turn-helix transcriptional regulator [Flavisphingomonas formosensis]|uniref:MarR family winged helix-turn-helix transcriptional regulator n=1 Tax=Flavisphingomonas formosensis TaxID=861534 RepID=UPI0012FBCE1D|nr:MarR family winged helix-turn-helix transcriptional regulator [Sphingomonas formosensis]
MIPFPTASCVCTALKKASRAVSRCYDEALAGTQLTTAQFALIRNLARNGEMPLSRLAEAMVMDRTSLYRALEPLTREGWIAIAPQAGRAKSAAVTPEGMAVMENATKAWESVQQMVIERLGMSRWEALQALLTEVTDAAR